MFLDQGGYSVSTKHPVAYWTLTGEWLCRSCWKSDYHPGSPFYASDLLKLSDAAKLTCRDCGNPLAGKTDSEPCVFCDIIAGTAPVEWAMQPNYWPETVAFFPRDPIAKGHVLLVPKLHVQDFAEQPEITGMVSQRAAELMRFTFRPMVMLSLRGEEAGQEVMHFHLHLIPREAGDGLRVPSWKEGGR